MIVKDEAHVIERCLASVKHLIDHWVIVDTGSSDDTAEVITRYLADVPGALHHREWKDFGTNRTEALTLARDTADYTLFIDADEELTTPDGFEWGELGADSYALLHAHGESISFWRTGLVNNRLPWRWEGVLHEYLTCDGARTPEKLHGPWFHSGADGGRSQISSVAEKYARDAAVLERALAAEPDHARYTFYLAQSYRDAGQLEKAAALYERRAAMNDWAEETWYALFQVGVLAERLGASESDVVDKYLRAFDFRPIRNEPLVNLARFLRGRRRFASARVFAAQAAEMTRPDDVLFVDESCYSWRSLDELSIADYWTGNFTESAQICEHLLASTELPERERARVTENLRFARDRLDRQFAIQP